MFGRPRHTQILLVFATFKVEVVHAAVSICVVSIETDALQGGSNKPEVTLICYFHSEQIGVAGIAGLGKYVVFVIVVCVVGDALVYDEVIDFL